MIVWGNRRRVAIKEYKPLGAAKIDRIVAYLHAPLWAECGNAEGEGK